MILNKESMKIKLLAISLVISLLSYAQVTDTVSTGSAYANQVWYSLEHGEQAISAQNRWDLAFQITGFSASILINDGIGAQLYTYPNGDTSAWSSIDTSGMTSWTPSYNSPHSWDEGAFNQGLDTSNSFDLGWGNYSFITHHVTADSLYIWKSPTGNLKKIWIERLASGTFHFKHANVDGSSLVQVALAKSNFSGKAFAYYNIAQDSILDLEPAADRWDLVFSKYLEFIPVPYSVSGIRSNPNVEVAQVYPVDPASYNGYLNANYSDSANVIGYDWKSFDMSTFSWQLADSTVYFVKSDTNYWKLVMTDFGGSANGNYIFTKKKINQSTALFEREEEIGSLILYPNPTAQRNISLVTDFKQAAVATLRVINLNGQIVQEQSISASVGMQTQALQLEQLRAGVYFVRLDHPSGSLTKKLILK